MTNDLIMAIGDATTNCILHVSPVNQSGSTGGQLLSNSGGSNPAFEEIPVVHVL